MKPNILHFFALISPLVVATELCQLNLADLTKKAEQGDPMAQVMLGSRYHFGQTKEDLEKDYAKALYWYKKSAEQGNAIAHYQLGNMYQFGRGVEKDGKKAFEWHLKAAELGESS